MTSSIFDAVGRLIREGDTVGGTTSGRYQATIVGPVIQLGKGKVKIRVTNVPKYACDRPNNADEKWISADRVILTDRADDRTFRGFRSPEGRVWTVAARTAKTLFESPTSPKRYSPDDLQRMYGFKLEAVWDEQPATPVVCDAEGHAVPHTAGCPDGPAPAPTEAEIRAAAFAEGAARITALPQDWELDPGRGDSAVLLQRLAAEAHQPGKYPLALPWALLMDDDDLRELLVDLFHTLSALYPVYGEQPKTPLQILACVEKTAAGYRAIAESQHAHNTAPGPDHVCNSVTARGHMDEPLGYLICGICGTPKGGAQHGRDTAAPGRDHA